MNVTIYSTPTCHFCKEAKAYLTSKGVDFEEVNLAGNKEKIQHVRDISGGTSVPVIEIGNTVIVGFSPGEIDDALKE